MGVFPIQDPVECVLSGGVTKFGFDHESIPNQFYFRRMSDASQPALDLWRVLLKMKFYRRISSERIVGLAMVASKSGLNSIASHLAWT